MSWQFQDQEQENIDSLRRRWRNYDGLDVQGQNNCVQDCFIQGFMSSHTQNMSAIHEWMRINNFQEFLREVQTVQDFIQFVSNIMLVQEFQNNPEELGRD